jgi:DMSO/TMAO reductase YedYZ molybdopterin-dependent catalytic subunit
MRSRLAHAGFGVLSTLVGVAAGHLVASLTEPASSPVIAVGSTVIDLTPTPMKEWAIRNFGTHDKTILVGSVLVGVLVLAAVAGLVARRRFAYGAGLLLALVLIPAAAALTRPGAGVTDLVPSIAAAVLGLAALTWLTREAELRPGDPTDGSNDRAGRTDDRTDDLTDDLIDDRAAGASRRGVLVATGALAVAGAAMGGAGRWITSYRTRTTVVDLPAAADPAPAFPAGLDARVPGISPFRTATEDFYRVDTRLTLPIVDLDGWSLTIDGDVDREVTFSFDDLVAMELVERDITLTCVSNDVGGTYVGAARWLGVPLAVLLGQAGIDGTRADQILSTDVDGMTISTPLALATDGRDAMIAIGMNGTSLPQEHGFPARMVVPGLYGFVSACKWITRMTLTTYAEQDAYWTKRDWATDAPIKISSRIDTPKPLSTIDAGRTVIGGVAWAQHQKGVQQVEVRVDGGPWQQARLGPSAGDDYWRQWYLPWTAETGQHSLAVRTVDGEGDVQTPVRATPFPEGSSGIQEIVVTVA